MSETKITTYPLDGVEYSAEDAAAHFVLRTDGVFDVKNDFKVSDSSDHTTVTVSEGIAFVRPSRFAGYSIVMREPTILTVSQNDSALDRYDRVILRFDAAAQKSYLMILKGEPSSNPKAPDITRTEAIYDLGLAILRTYAEGGSKHGSYLTQDTRKDETLCGCAVDDGIYTEYTTEVQDSLKQVRSYAQKAGSNSSMSSSWASRAEAAASRAEGYADELKALLDSKK